MKLSICYLAHRPYTIKFSDILFNYLCKIKPEYKFQICVKILFSGNHHLWQRAAENLVSNGIETYLADFPFTVNYFDKVVLSTQSDTKYCCKVDEDCWINNHLWEYIIDNLEILDDDKNVILSPLLSNNVSCVEDFVEELGTTDEVNEIYNSFHSYKFIPLFGADYTPLNVVNNTTTSWNKNLFYGEVEKLNHYYKGIHPIKLQEESQIKVNNLAIKYYDKIKNKQNYKLEMKFVPYVNNTLCFIKTETWKKILSDRSLFKDVFDEVPINLYAHKNHMNYVFVKHGFGIHAFGNYIKNYESLQHEFCQKYTKLL